MQTHLHQSLAFQLQYNIAQLLWCIQHKQPMLSTFTQHTTQVHLTFSAVTNNTSYGT